MGFSDDPVGYDLAELAQTLFEEAGDALFLFDPESEQLVDVNPLAQKLTGYTRRELLQMQVTYLFRSEAQGGVHRLRQAFRKTGVFHSQEGFLLRHQRDGVWIPINLSVARLHAEPHTLGLITVRDIREQRETFQQLKKTEAELRRVLASVSDFVWSAEVDASGRFNYRFCSPVIEHVTGRPPEFFLAGADRWLSILHPDDRERMLQGQKKLANSPPGVYAEEYRIVRPDGTVRWIRDSVTLTRNSAGGTLRLDGVGSDITDRHHAQEHLREGQKRLLVQNQVLVELAQQKTISSGDLTAALRDITETAARTIDVARVGIWLFSEDRDRLCCLDLYERSQNRHSSGQELYAAQFPAYFRAMELDRVIAAADARNDPATREFSETYLSPCNIGAMLDAPIRLDGVLLGVVCHEHVGGQRAWKLEEQTFAASMADFVSLAVQAARRREVEENLKRSEHRYRDLVETSNDLIWSLDAAGQWTFINREAARRVYGYEPEEMLGRPFTDFVPPQQIGRDLISFEEIKSGERRFQYETVHTRKDGQPVHLVFNAIVLCDENGQVLGTRGTATDITHRRQTEQILNRQHALLRGLIESIPDLIMFKDTLGRYQGCNAAFEAYVGRKEIELRGRTARELFPPEIAAAYELHDKEVLTQDRTLRDEQWIEYPDGRRVLVEVMKTPFHGPNGELQGLIGVGRDITERKRAEDALIERALLFNLRADVSVALAQRERLPAILQRCAEVLYRNLDVAFFRIWTLNDAEQVLELQASAGLYAHLDGPHARVPMGQLKIGRIAQNRQPLFTNSVQDDPHIADKEWAAREGMEAFAGYPLVVEDRLVGVMATFARRPFKESTLNGLLSIADVIAQCIDRKKAEDALQDSEARYRTLIENLEQSVFLKDSQLRFKAVNRRFAQALGKDEPEIIGKTDYDFYPAHLADKYRADDLRVLQKGQRLEVEEENLMEGRTRIVRVIKTPVKDEAGNNVAVLGIFWDVSEQRVLESQLRQAQKMDAIGQLAGGVAHDFNNLLTAILGNLSLVLNNVPENDINRPLLLAADKASQRAAELVRKLLGFSRRSMLRLEPMSLNAAVQETVDIFRRTIDPKVQIEVRSSPHLWPVHADHGQVNQVLMNLCLNARDAMPIGGRLLIETENVKLTEEEARSQLGARVGEFACLRISDTGHGMSEETRLRIFEPFFTTKGPGKGLGLGLAMVGGIIAQHHGWIECESAINRGTTFKIFLPRHHLPEPIAGTPPAQEPVFGNETILFVEDESVVRAVGRTILQRYGYKVLEAEDGVKALEIYRQEQDRIDLVLLDLTMPRLSGQETLRELRNINPNVRVVLCSGYSAEPPVLPEDSCVLGFVGKPYRPAALGQAIRRALDSGRGGPPNSVAAAGSLS